MTKTRTAVLMVIGMLVAAFAFASPAAAKDRNNDGLPDRWEKRYDLSLKVKQGKRDQDSDGLNNMGEFEAGTNPRHDDSDDDGTDDGDENAGTITAFDGTTLTIDLFNGGTITGTVDENTVVKCASECGKDGDDGTDDQGTGAERRNPGQGQDGTEGPDNSGPGSDDSGHGPGHQGEGDEGQAPEDDCSIDDLAVDEVVSEAELHLKNGDAVFDEIGAVSDELFTLRQKVRAAR